MKRLSSSSDQQFLHSLPTENINIPEKYVLTMAVRLPGALPVQLSMVLADQCVTQLGAINSNVEAEERCSVVCVPALLEMLMDVSQTQNLTNLNQFYDIFTKIYGVMYQNNSQVFKNYFNDLKLYYDEVKDQIYKPVMVGTHSLPKIASMRFPTPWTASMMSSTPWTASMMSPTPVDDEYDVPYPVHGECDIPSPGDGEYGIPSPGDGKYNIPSPEDGK